MSKLTSGRSLFAATLRGYRAHWKAYVALLSIIAVPSALLNLIGASDSLSSALVAFAAIIMNTALIWSIARNEKTGKFPSIKQAYYDGSEALVRFLSVSLLLVIMLIPAALATILLDLSFSAGDQLGQFSPEAVILGIAAGLIASPSIYLMVRYALAYIGVVRDGLHPVAALRRARQHTLGRFWTVFGRFIVLGLFLFLISIPGSLLAAGFAMLKLPTLGVVVFQLIAALSVLPIANLYLFGLYRELQANPRPPKAKA